VALRVVARRLNAGVSLQAVRRAVEYLKHHTERPLSTLALAAKGNRVFVLTGNPAKIIEATAQGQVVIAIDVEPIVRDLRADVTELSAAREIDVRVRGRGYRAVLTPDLEAGGYTIEVPELPGCITEADSLPEARRMMRGGNRSLARGGCAPDPSQTRSREVAGNPRGADGQHGRPAHDQGAGASSV